MGWPHQTDDWLERNSIPQESVDQFHWGSTASSSTKQTDKLQLCSIYELDAAFWKRENNYTWSAPVRWMKLSKIDALNLSITSMANSSSPWNDKEREVLLGIMLVKSVYNPRRREKCCASSDVITLPIPRAVCNARTSLRTFTESLRVAGRQLQSTTSAKPSTMCSTPKRGVRSTDREWPLPVPY